MNSRRSVLTVGFAVTIVAAVLSIGQLFFLHCLIRAFVGVLAALF